MWGADMDPICKVSKIISNYIFDANIVSDIFPNHSPIDYFKTDGTYCLGLRLYLYTLSIHFLSRSRVLLILYF